MKKILFVLYLFSTGLYAQDYFVELVVENVEKRLQIQGAERTGLVLRNSPKQIFSWNALAYEAALSISITEALENPKAVKSLLQVSGEAFNADAFAESLTLDKIKPIQLNALKCMKSVHTKILSKIKSLPRTAITDDAVSKAKRVINQRVIMYSELINTLNDVSPNNMYFMDRVNQSIGKGMAGVPNSVAIPKVIQSFVRNSTDNIIEAIAQLSRLI